MTDTQGPGEWILPSGPPSSHTAADPAAPLLSGAGEDDQLLGRSGHRHIAVDRPFDALAERVGGDEDDQAELEPLGQLRGQRPDARGGRDRGIAYGAGRPGG